MQHERKRGGEAISSEVEAIAAREEDHAATRSRGRGIWLNDVHSLLNKTRVAAVERPRSLEELEAVVRTARREGRALSVGGGLHAMGGQQFGRDTIHVDTRGLARVITFDRQRGRLEVEAGIEWPAVIAACRAAPDDADPGWGIVQKQTGADRICVGGALAANAHGRALTRPPIVGDVESFLLVDARGETSRCSRTENAELFGLAIGGYGLFGVIHSVVLRLKRREKVRRAVELCTVDELLPKLGDAIARGATYGDFQFEIDARSPGFLSRGVLSCYEPVDPRTPIRAGRELTREEWLELLVLAHTDPARAFARYATHYLSTDGQVYRDDEQQIGRYPEGYHVALDARLGARRAGSEMISELYVPRAALPGFLRDAADLLRARRSTVIYGTIRLIERDDETLLAWAREPWACTVLNLHVDHDARSIAGAAETFRALIDLALARRGSYFLTYHRWATRRQAQAAHPRLAEFLRRKQRFDPEETFQSDWYRHHLGLLAGEPITPAPARR